MDLTDLRAAFSVIMFVLLAGIYIWAWSKNRKHDFNEAANLPFNEPEYPAKTHLVEPSSTTNKNNNGHSGDKS